ncbi:spore cortex-lytic enzyme [Neobacillus bataviensis LMG 21833]|uniref:Spore cortex-lytic enzyme n=1 Tax=Neobacillus bataviensis LMG 21833 TaxID=1117379 RepID=K6BUW3_9BACI|nr:cell wall hydrolase [Neobacillus bataviensis]EKN62715.1 spore cortex-lytic enzyme [Neobacillus bataviensis LMG 21833]
MKNTHMKKLVVACVATFAFICLQNNTVEAITENQAVKENNLLELGQQYGLTTEKINLENNRHDDGIYIEELSPNPDKPQMEGIQSSNPEMEKPEKAPEEPAVSISNEEKDLFARLVEAEAKGESNDGKVAVATVVLNRVDSPHFPNTITDVIKQEVGNTYAFSPVQNGEINKPASDESKQAVEEALTRNDRLNDSIYFYNPEIATDDWIRTREVVKTIGDHVFAK